METSRERAARILGGTNRWLLLSILLLAPLPFGSVGPRSVLFIQLGTALALVLWGARVVLGHEPGMPASRPGLIALALFLALVAFQLVSLPEGLLETLSPAAARFYRHLHEAGGEALAGISFPWTLSLAPAETGEALRRLLAVLAVLLLVCSSFRGRTRLRMLAGGLVILGTLEAAYGLLETLSGREQIFGYVKQYYTGVVTGTYINQNHFAGLMEICLPVALGLVLSRRGAGEGASSWREALGRLSTRRASVNLFLVIGLVTMLMGLALSLSRSGIIFGLLGMAVVALGVTARRRGWRGILVTGLVVVAALSFLVLGSLEKVGGEFARLETEFDTPGHRFTVWRDALHAVADYPLSGTGLGSFAAVFPLYRSAEVRMYYDHAHNDLLQALVETGITGTLLLLLALGAGAVLVIRRLREEEGSRFALRLGFAGAALALSLHSLTDFNLRIPANALLYAAAIGTALSTRPHREAPEPSQAPIIPFPEPRNEE